MPEVHILNVGAGDCVILKSGKDHVTVFDISKGNMPAKLATLAEDFGWAKNMGNFRMCKHPTNPIEFLKVKMEVKTIFRFILSHPDMDHMDGFGNLFDHFSVLNYWDSGVRKEKPEFTDESPYQESDWDRYEKVRDGKESGVTVVGPLAGASGKYYNDDDNNDGGDYIQIYAPDKELVTTANDGGDINDASYVIAYRTAGGRVLLCGDAHDATWDYILANYKKALSGCELMIAPHHGRDSDRKWDFLDELKPKFSILGCASSEHLAYDAWNSRGLAKITQNQAGNIAVYPSDRGLELYIENARFAEKNGGNTSVKDRYGNSFLATIPKPA